MIDTPTTNPTLTFDQLQAIDTTKKILSNLESEITNAQKILRGTKMECDRAVKEKEYQEELVSDLSSQTQTLSDNLNAVKKEITETTEFLNKLRAEIKISKERQDSKEIELQDRENKLISKESDLNKKEQTVNEDLEIFSKNEKDFYSKVAKLKEVISIF